MITSISRRDLGERLGSSWSGRLEGTEFLSRLYDLGALPSNDGRRKDMAGDIFQHTQANEDWAPDCRGFPWLSEPEAVLASSR
jgi:AbiJ N-terminal domain 3